MINIKELKKLAVDAVDGKIFGTWNMKESDSLEIVFMPIALMDDNSRQGLIDKDVFHIYEYIDKAGPRSINGLPIFSSFKGISKEEWDQTVLFIEEYKNKKKEFLEECK